MFQRSNIPLFFILIFFLNCQAGAQIQFGYNADAERTFTRAIAMFNSGKYREAIPVFDRLIQMQPIHQRTTAAYIMIGKTRFELKEYRESAVILLRFIDAYPESDYLDDAHYTLGIDYMMLRQYEKAAIEFLQSMELSKDFKLTSRASSLFESIADERFNDEMLSKLLSNVEKLDVRDFVIIKLAEKFYAEGFALQALRMLENVLKRETASKYYQRARALQKRAEENANLKIGAMLPLMRQSSSNQVKTLADEVLDGITYALDEYKISSSSALNVTLEIKDTERDKLVAVNELKELSGDKDVIAVVGPLFSNLAFACAPVANTERIPLLTPTATSNGIAANGNYVFQLNPDFATRGKAMARYAVQELRLQVLAVLASSDTIGKMLAESFSEEASHLGASILAVETFTKGTDDLRAQFMNLRKAAAHEEPRISFTGKMTRHQLTSIIRAGADRKLVDSLRATGGSVGVTKLFGPRGRQIANSLHLKLIVPAAATEDIEVPVTSIQGIFLPLSDAEEIGAVASQLAYYNIKTQLLGSNEWYNPAQLESNKRYVNGAIFFSDSYVDREDSFYISFERTFISQMKKRSTQNTLFGYDAMKLLLHCIDEGATTRETLASVLSKVKGFRGIHSSITLHRGRVNSEIHILKYYNGEIKKIGNISVN